MKGENRTIILFTSTYPYSAVAESFLDPEMTHLASTFENVILVPRNYPSDREFLHREFPENVNVDTSYLEKYGRGKWSVKIGSILRALMSFHLYGELIERPVAIRFASLKRLIWQLSEAFQVRDWVKGFMDRKDSPEPSQTILYTYWLNGCTIGIALAKARNPGIKLVSRAHRGDLYEEIRDPPYLPCRGLMLRNIDRLFLISEDGRKYISERFPRFVDKYTVSRLGVPDPGFITPPSDDEVFRIVSCSYLIPVKRINLLIEGLREIGESRPNRHFKWIHIGYGPLESSLKKYASAILPPNTEHQFLGYLPYGGVMEWYRENPVDVFVNVSGSEGIPVSIMEAQSCGIPAIATGVGGTPEIVSEENGMLLDTDPKPQDIAETVLTMMDDPESAMKKRVKSKENWSKNYNSDINFAQFALTLRSLRSE
jgi:colanic acid/amylovoran biosynthesis glycosyltransferase